jgi:hypothetical protein
LRAIETTTNATVAPRPPGITWVEYRAGARDSVADAEQ